MLKDVKYVVQLLLLTYIRPKHGQSALTNPYTYENLHTNYFSRGRQLPPYARVSVVSYVL